MEFKVKKNTGYTIMSNHHLRNKNLSLKSKGLLSLILSLPDNWDYSLAGLTTLSKDGLDGVRAGLKELQNEGYLVIERLRDNKGRLGKTSYIVYEEPIQTEKSDIDNFVSTEIQPISEKPILENPTLENPTLEKPILENPTQINTNLNNYLSKEEIKDIYTNSKINFEFFDTIQDYGFKNLCFDILKVYQKILDIGADEEKRHILEFDNNNILSVANKMLNNKSPIKYRQAYIKSILLNHTSQELNELRV